MVKEPKIENVIHTMEVMPGEEGIVLLRVCNSDVREINFPPPVDLQIMPIL